MTSQYAPKQHGICFWSFASDLTTKKELNKQKKHIQF